MVSVMMEYTVQWEKLLAVFWNISIQFETYMLDRNSPGRVRRNSALQIIGCEKDPKQKGHDTAQSEKL